jgi:segregation and condensation protein A
VDEPSIPQSAAFQVQLPMFEGPLDLLLHLIKRHELDVLDLPIAFVTARYLDYLQMMQELDLDVASEYLLMAATLAHIKSKMLLPAAPSDNLEEQEEGYLADPRAELIRRLLEYQKYKAAAGQLGSRSLAGRDVFPRGLSAPEAQGPAPLAGIDLYKLLDAFQGILKRIQGRVALEVTAETITIHERISQLSDLLRVKRNCVFEELFEAARSRYEVIVTFLALLEMTKLRITRIYQADPTSALHVQYALLDADAPTIPPDALTADARVEVDAALDAVAEEHSTLMAQADASSVQAPAEDLALTADAAADELALDAAGDEAIEDAAGRFEATDDEIAALEAADDEAAAFEATDDEIAEFEAGDDAVAAFEATDDEAAAFEAADDEAELEVTEVHATSFAAAGAADVEPADDEAELEVTEVHATSFEAADADVPGVEAPDAESGAAATEVAAGFDLGEYETVESEAAALEAMETWHAVAERVDPPTGVFSTTERSAITTDEQTSEDAQTSEAADQPSKSIEEEAPEHDEKS